LYTEAPFASAAGSARRRHSSFHAEDSKLADFTDVSAGRLTVVQVLPDLQGGGVERGTLEVAAELARRGHRSIVISAGGRMVEELERAGSEHVAWPIGRKSLATLRLVPRLRRFLRHEGVDILHARSRLPAWIAWLAWRGMREDARPRFVTTVHGLYSVNRYSAVMTRGERVEVVSETVRRYVLDNYPKLDPSRIELIYRGVDPAEFPYGFQPSPAWLDEWYKRYPQLRGSKIVTLPGRLTRLKGHHAFIEMISRVHERGFRVHGLIVGGEDPRRREYARELEREVEAKGLGRYVTFAGHRSDMREIYAVSDLVLSLSAKPESFGRTVLEALSLGTPVLGYDHGGVGEILAHVYPMGRTPVDDVATLVDKVTALLFHPVAVPREHPFPLQRMLDGTLNLYESLAVRGRGAEIE
jgi:glycosyltransferase involved in cell wall biosynthesis